MLNKKGQVLVVFVLILPLILIFLGLVIDIGNRLVIKKKNENILKDIVIYTYKTLEKEENELLEEDEESNIEETKKEID